MLNAQTGPAAGADSPLLTLNRLLATALTAGDVKRVILEHAIPASGACAGSLIKVVDADTLVMVGSHGYQVPLTEVWQQFPADRGFAVADAIARQAPVFAAAQDIERDYPAMHGLLQPETRAVAVLPLVARGQVLSAVTLSFTHEDAISPERQQFLQALFEDCALALCRGRQYDDEHYARERAQLLSLASEVLAASLDVPATLDHLTRLAIEHVADWCVVYLPDAEGRMWPEAVAHQDPGKIDLLRWYIGRYQEDPERPGSNGWIMRTGEPVLVPVVPEAAIDALPEEAQREAIRSMGLHSVISVPLPSPQGPIGVLGLASSHLGRAYGADDLQLAQELAKRASAALLNATQHQASVRSEERYRSLVDATTQTVWTADANGELHGEQPGWVALTGQTPEQFHGVGWAERIHPDDRGRSVRAWLAATEQRAVYELQHRIRVRSGEYRIFHSRAVPVLEAGGQVREWVGVSTDITAQIEAEQALRAMNATLEEKVAVRTQHLHAARRQAEVLALLGDALQRSTSPEEVARITLETIGKELGASCMIVAPVADHALLPRTTWGDPPPLVSRQLAQPALRLEDTPILKSVVDQGEAIYLDSYAEDARSVPGLEEYALAVEPILTQGGEVKGGLVAWRPAQAGAWTPGQQDLLRRAAQTMALALQRTEIAAELQRQRDELEAANASLKRSNAELERFAFVASHDLQEPLRTITSFTQLLDRRYGTQLDDSGRRYLGFVVSGAGRMKGLIDDLLVFSRLNTVQDPLRPLFAGDAVQGALSGLQGLIETTGARVHVHPLPEVAGDLRELTQVFQNLIGNGIKFHRPDVSPEITISAEADGGDWLFRVQDNGIGIEAGYLDRVFGMFQRLHTREEYEGTGLGLSIVRKVIERHGGRVWLESEVGSGTTVKFTLRSAGAVPG
ncbi:GAF domain-containing protein [Deinococcus enclensis]|uniref:histidine kinase n=1 Tax=Deinococcus enclensis TaxID=1049582 RepID=A0ABT9MIN2_9DEIO|nr:GAF domain-containing protein [Deinococcus enclensis]MDP9766462.1 PAS domain S-box-containing protein [Deinococcus enclensis]